MRRLTRLLSLLICICFISSAVAETVYPGTYVQKTIPASLASPELVRTGSTDTENYLAGGEASLASDVHITSAGDVLLGYNDVWVSQPMDGLYGIGDVEQVETPYGDITQFRQEFYISADQLANLFNLYRESGILPTQSTYTSGWEALLAFFTGDISNLDEFADSTITEIKNRARKSLGDAANAINDILRKCLDLSDEFKNKAMEVTQNTVDGTGQTADETFNKLTAMLMSRWLAPGGMFDMYAHMFELQRNGYRIVGGTQFVGTPEIYGAENTASKDERFQAIKDFVNERVDALNAYAYTIFLDEKPTEGENIRRVNASAQEALNMAQNAVNAQAYQMGLASYGEDIGLDLTEDQINSHDKPGANESTMERLENGNDQCILYEITDENGNKRYQIYIEDEDTRKHMRDSLSMTNELADKLAATVDDMTTAVPFTMKNNVIHLTLGLETALVSGGGLEGQDAQDFSNAMISLNSNAGTAFWKLEEAVDVEWLGWGLPPTPYLDSTKYSIDMLIEETNAMLDMAAYSATANTVDDFEEHMNDLESSTDYTLETLAANGYAIDFFAGEKELIKATLIEMIQNGEIVGYVGEDDDIYVDSTDENTRASVIDVLHGVVNRNWDGIALKDEDGNCTTGMHFIQKYNIPVHDMHGSPYAGVQSIDLVYDGPEPDIAGLVYQANIAALERMNSNFHGEQGSAENGTFGLGYQATASTQFFWSMEGTQRIFAEEYEKRGLLEEGSPGKAYFDRTMANFERMEFGTEMTSDTNLYSNISISRTTQSVISPESMAVYGAEGIIYWAMEEPGYNENIDPSEYLLGYYMSNIQQYNTPFSFSSAPQPSAAAIVREAKDWSNAQNGVKDQATVNLAFLEKYNIEYREFDPDNWYHSVNPEIYDINYGVFGEGGVFGDVFRKGEFIVHNKLSGQDEKIGHSESSTDYAIWSAGTNGVILLEIPDPSGHGTMTVEVKATDVEKGAREALVAQGYSPELISSVQVAMTESMAGKKTPCFVLNPAALINYDNPETPLATNQLKNAIGGFYMLMADLMQALGGIHLTVPEEFDPEEPERVFTDDCDETEDWWKDNIRVMFREVYGIELSDLELEQVWDSVKNEVYIYGKAIRDGDLDFTPTPEPVIVIIDDWEDIQDIIKDDDKADSFEPTPEWVLNYLPDILRTFSGTALYKVERMVTVQLTSASAENTDSYYRTGYKWSLSHNGSGGAITSGGNTNGFTAVSGHYDLTAYETVQAEHLETYAYNMTDEWTLQPSGIVVYYKQTTGALPGNAGAGANVVSLRKTYGTTMTRELATWSVDVIEPEAETQYSEGTLVSTGGMSLTYQTTRGYWINGIYYATDPQSGIMVALPKAEDSSTYRIK